MVEQQEEDGCEEVDLEQGQCEVVAGQAPRIHD